MEILVNLLKKYKERREINGVVYKLSYGGKYVIVKGKTLTGSLYFIQLGFTWFRKDTDNPKVLYRWLYKHVVDNPGKRWRLKVLSKSKRPYFLLKREQMEIDRNQYDNNFLANTLEAYVPEFDENKGMHNWISVSDVLLFRKYFKSRKRKALLKQYKQLQHLKLAKNGL